MKKIEKKGKQKPDGGDNAATGGAEGGRGGQQNEHKIKDENDKPISSYIKDEVQSKCDLIKSSGHEVRLKWVRLIVSI